LAACTLLASCGRHRSARPDGAAGRRWGGHPARAGAGRGRVHRARGVGGPGRSRGGTDAAAAGGAGRRRASRDPSAVSRSSGRRGDVAAAGRLVGGGRPDGDHQGRRERSARVPGVRRHSDRTACVAGPLTALDRKVFLPAQHQADGGRLFTTEIRGDLKSARVVVREPGAEPAEVRLSKGAVFSVVFAGELVAYAEPAPGQPADDEPQRLRVSHWRTGRPLVSVRVPTAACSPLRRMRRPLGRPPPDRVRARSCSSTTSWANAPTAGRPAPAPRGAPHPPRSRARRPRRRRPADPQRDRRRPRRPADGPARRHRRLEQLLRASPPDQPAPHRRPRRGRLEVAWRHASAEGRPAGRRLCPIRGAGRCRCSAVVAGRVARRRRTAFGAGGHPWVRRRLRACRLDSCPGRPLHDGLRVRRRAAHARWTSWSTRPAASAAPDGTTTVAWSGVRSRSDPIRLARSRVDGSFPVKAGRRLTELALSGAVAGSVIAADGTTTLLISADGSTENAADGLLAVRRSPSAASFGPIEQVTDEPAQDPQLTLNAATQAPEVLWSGPGLRYASRPLSAQASAPTAPFPTRAR